MEKSMANTDLSVFIVDDDPFIRESLSLLIGMDPHIEVIGTACNGLEAVHKLQDREAGLPDVMLMDIRMPECDGVEGTKRIKALFPQISVLILTTFDDDEFIIEALQSGASGYLLKNIPPDRIIQGIKTVHSGSMLIHPDIARKLTGMLRPPDRGENSTSAPLSAGAAPYAANDGSSIPSADDRPQANLLQSKLKEAGLTTAEQNVVALIAEGMSNREIAQKLFLSEGTVKNYITDILAKLQVRDRTQIAILYWKNL
ncbi:response regulator [Paenibacillus lentus]|uniref:response regulator n=1 Tax=Paenibacillus lentus TaxID=1338368 RepID=UPI00365B6F31